TATLLLNGKVLIAGGFNRNTGFALSSAELYDPATGTWTVTGSLATARDYHTATLMLNGKVLVAGGAPDAAGYSSLSSVEVYDPGHGTWTATGSLNATRATHTASLLPGGQVLVAAGYYVNGPAWLSSAELYDSAAGPITLINPVKLPGGAFQFAFTGASNGTNTVLATTNATLALSNWMVLGAVPEFSAGLFLFS